MVAWAMAALIALTCLLAALDFLLASVIVLLDLLQAETAHRLSTVLFEPLDGLFSFYEPPAHPAQPHRRHTQCVRQDIPTGIIQRDTR